MGDTVQLPLTVLIHRSYRFFFKIFFMVFDLQFFLFSKQFVRSFEGKRFQSKKIEFVVFKSWILVFKNLRKSLCFSYRRESEDASFLKKCRREETHSNGERGGGWANCPKSSEIRGKDVKIRDSFREKSLLGF